METIPLEKPTIVKPVVAPDSITDRNAVAPPTSTAEQDRHSGGQRRTNLLWEGTQATMALIIMSAVVYCALFRTDIPENLSNFFYVIIGFYFGRTNHQRVGGVDLGR